MQALVRRLFVFPLSPISKLRGLGAFALDWLGECRPTPPESSPVVKALQIWGKVLGGQVPPTYFLRVYHRIL